jgi:tetratricopeptide (TPR) repeat protein
MTFFFSFGSTQTGAYRTDKKTGFVSFLALCLFLFFSPLSSCKLFTHKSSPAVGAKQENNTELDRQFVDACKEKIKGNYELAVTGFNNCLKIDPRQGASHYELAGLYNAQGRTDLALSNAKEAVQSDPANQWYLQLYAQILQDNHNNAEAAAIYQKLIKLSPEKVEYYYGYSDALLYQGKYKDAIKVYDEIETKMGPSEEVSLQKVKVLDRTGDFDKATEELRKLIVLNPQETKYYVILGQMYMDHAAEYKSKGNKEKESEMTEKAHQVYTGLLQSDPRNPFALLALAEYFLSKSMYDSAFVKYKDALANPDLDMESKGRVEQKYFFESESDPKIKSQCEELCKIMLDANPNESLSHSLYADFLYREKRTKDARNEYRKAADLNKSKDILWGQLLQLDYELNDYTDMLADSKDAIELFPSQPTNYFFNGVAYVQARKYKEGIDALNSGIIYVIDNKSLEGQFESELGDAYYKLKDYSKSFEAYDKSVALVPDDGTVLNNYSYYLSLQNTNLDKAEKMSKHAIELEPKNANFDDTYAWILYRLARYPEAKDWMEKAISATEPSAVMLEHYGDILYHLDQKDQALLYWEKAKAKGSGSEFLDKKITEKKLYE